MSVHRLTLSDTDLLNGGKWRNLKGRRNLRLPLEEGKGGKKGEKGGRDDSNKQKKGEEE